jgi:hypothetical protein
MKKLAGRLFVTFLLLSVAWAASGCSYMKKRGNDALDIFDIGFTVTNKLKPDLAVYLDFFGRTPIGAASVDGKLLGIGARRAGLLDYHISSWGLLAWGTDKYGSGEFNAADPYQARDDQRDLTERPRFNTGFVRMSSQDNAPPPIQFVACDKLVHLGYVGFLANCRPAELLDFVLGWTTADMLQDDDLDGPIRSPGAAKK